MTRNEMRISSMEAGMNRARRRARRGVLGIVAGVGLMVAPAMMPAAAIAQRPARGQIRPIQPERRAQLVQRYRDHLEQVVRTRLNLNDDQMRKLRDVNNRMEGRRRELNQEERATRLAIRDEVAKGSSANQTRVTQLMNDAQRLAQQRLALQQQERDEVSGFLTPVQQAQYFGLQAQLRKRTHELEAEQGDGGGGSPR